MCSGACPLYWEHKGSFEEIEMVRKKKPWIKNMIWHIEKKMRVSTQGIKGINN